MNRNNKRNPLGVEYDPEALCPEEYDSTQEWLFGEHAKHRRKAEYILKEVRAGNQLDVEMYPLFSSMDKVPENARTKRDNSKAQRNLNDRNARKHLVWLINTNFVNGDLWITLTYDDEHLPADMERAQRDIHNWIRRVNYRRRKQGLPKAKYIYVTEHGKKNDRWHHHIVIDGALSGEELESLWKLGRRNEIRHLDADEAGFAGMANYIAKEKDREKYEKRWSSSQGLKEPTVRVVKSKQPSKGVGSYRKIETYVREMVEDQDTVQDRMARWYPDYDFTDSRVYCNSFNGFFYIRSRLRRKQRLRI